MNDYEKSNKTESVALSRFSKKGLADFLACGESASERQSKGQALCDYLCERFDLPKVKVFIVERAQPHSHNCKLHGTYAVGREVIRCYNFTAIKQKPVAIRTLADTLLHEFMHHYDHLKLRLDQSLHTAGFYKRISDLKRKLS